MCGDGIGSFLCDCTLGFTGQLCETEINECEVLNINCSENRQCFDEVNSYTCVCNAGYTGADCVTDIDDCVNVNCSGNGVCVCMVSTRSVVSVCLATLERRAVWRHKVNTNFLVTLDILVNAIIISHHLCFFCCRGEIR